ncbi:shikimate kinase [[Clostridium] fimetarium]|uniref:Shikimate kinase n=1 Tax=[Clostridium] fimetarium TaxID=99656 RepID=A0A1I0NKB2_9FIRM|nr:shikimate kinase [[Clostridium] fimetarium]SEW01699.1 shikimate kinase [[Clostridium] fimetarium]
MNNIILIGMPGAGKSTVGVVLAKVLGYKFLDSDLVIQEKEEKLLSQLIEEYGDAGFIKIENDVNKSIEVDHTVIATGGSAVYGTEAMEHFRRIGTVIYLEVPYKEIENRVGSLKDRGVVSNGKTKIEDIYSDRIALYETYAHVIIKEWDIPIRETIEKILGCKELENRL